MKNPFLKTLVTEDDANEVWCPIRLAFVFSFFALHGFTAIAILHGQPFDPVAYGAAVAALTGGAGAGIFFNGRSEPPKGS